MSTPNPNSQDTCSGDVGGTEVGIATTAVGSSAQRGFPADGSLIHWLWSAAQTPGVTRLAVIGRQWRKSLFQQTLPRRMHELADVLKVVNGRHPNEMWRNVRLQLDGRFNFEVPMDEATRLTFRVPQDNPSGPQFFPVDYPNPVPVDVTTDIYLLRRAAGLPGLPCRCLAQGMMNEGDGWTACGNVELVDPWDYCIPFFVGENPVLEDDRLTERQLKILRALECTKDGAPPVVQKELGLVDRTIQPKSLRGDIERLKFLGLITSDSGCEGGYRITASGLRRIVNA